MSFDSLTNRGEYLPAHYLTAIFPQKLKQQDGLLTAWRDAEQAGRSTPRSGLLKMRRGYLKAKAELAELTDPERRAAVLHALHRELLAALGFPVKTKAGDSTDDSAETMTVTWPVGEITLPVVHADQRVVAIECEWAEDPDSATDPEGAGRLLYPVDVSSQERITSGVALARWLFAAERPPTYVLLLAGGVLVLADRRAWGEGRYLAANLDTAFARYDDRAGGELAMLAALFGADTLYPTQESGDDRLTEFLASGRQHAVAVSSELREGLRLSVELIANEVLDRLREAGVRPEQLADPRELGRKLTKEALRYLYRVLFLLYAEAKPELGVLPADYPEYVQGYSLARLGDLVTRKLVGESARNGFHLYESIDVLVRMVNDGYPPGGEHTTGEGIRFEAMRADLFLADAITLIGRDHLVHPDADPDDPRAPRLDTRLRNHTLYQVLRLLMLAKGSRGGRGGFISYAQLGINQLGAVYEGLMSYKGFIATEELYEVAKNGDPAGGSWVLPASVADSFPDEVFVREKDDYGRRTGPRIRHPEGSFVYRLSGRDRQKSASYYTPPSLTEVTVELALKHRWEQNGERTPAREILDWTVCEPALGSGAFLNEAINQLATLYLTKRQEELGVNLDPDLYLVEKQKVKTYIALHNCYGVDLNDTAVELAEVSLWLNVMHSDLQAPWFGLHLVQGNSLIGAGRRCYSPDQLRKKAWLKTTPEPHPLSAGKLPDGVVHHFLLPAAGWGIVAEEKEARRLAAESAAALRQWRNTIRQSPKTAGRHSQVKRLQALARRVEFLWDLVRQRLALSEAGIRREVPVWRAEDLPPADNAKDRKEILAELHAKGSPFWRLKLLMDAWCALWFWPLDKVSMLDGTAPVYAEHVRVQQVEERPVYEEDDADSANGTLFDVVDLGQAEQALLPLPPAQRRQVGTRRVTVAKSLGAPTPLSGIEEWIAFAEAVVGKREPTADTLYGGRDFTNLDDLQSYEENLFGELAYEHPHRLVERFPWLDTALNIADDQGFFHWELSFAQVFARGGFDLQVGNPPWFRPRWDESVVLAEEDPWFKLAEKPSVEEWDTRKEEILAGGDARDRFVAELAEHAGMGDILSHPAVYPLLNGTQPDLYRAFMCQTWSHLGPHGTAGLLHPDTHFGGVREGPLRAAAYRHLRMHGTFVNVSNWAFADLSRRQEFGIHIYGSPGEIRFEHLSQLHAARVLPDSPNDDGTREAPAQKINGKWDARPHQARVIKVSEAKLTEWRRLADEDTLPVDQTPLLYPISTHEEAAIAMLADSHTRLGAYRPQISPGYHEKNAKTDGYIRYAPQHPKSLEEVILQGPHFGIATPLAKEPHENVKSNNDWSWLSPSAMAPDALPRTTYQRASDRDSYVSAQDLWVDHNRLADLMSSPSALAQIREDLWIDTEPNEAQVEARARSIASRRYTEFFRLFWRSMIDPKGSERSLFAALLPPGPAHVHTVHSLALPSNRGTALAAGFWASLSLDYLLRITGRSHLQVGEALRMPAAAPDHPLATPLLLRTLRLNCLTQAYAPLWEDLFEPAWAETPGWTTEWPGLAPLGAVKPEWTPDTPLRSEYARWVALVEIDALVAVWLGLGIDELLAIYRSRYPILSDREAQMFFDAAGRRIAADSYAFGFGQSKEDYQRVVEYNADKAMNPLPAGYTPPFEPANREEKMRLAHAAFTRMLERTE